MGLQVKTPTTLGAYCRTLFGKDGELRMVELEDAMAKAMLRSFRQDHHPMRHTTDAEIKHRANIMIDWTRQLLYDGWCVARVCDHMDAILETELDGETWTPPERTIWMPQETDSK